MSDRKPDWYTRLKSGPFEEPIFDMKMQSAVELRSRSVKSAETNGKRRRAGAWAGGATAAALLALCALLFVPALGDPFRMAAGGGGGASEGGPAMTEVYVSAHLHVGMTEDQVKQAFGKPTEGMSVRRDFAASHVEDRTDIGTWTAVEAWRYDYEVRAGYEVQSDLGTDAGADKEGVRRGDIASQLVVIWKDGLVERAYYWYRDENGLAQAQYGPQMTSPDLPPSQAVSPEDNQTPDSPENPPEQPPEASPEESQVTTPSLPAANVGVRATGRSASGTFEIRPKKDGDERISLLGAPSCYGMETDLYFWGDYELYFRDAAGHETLVRELAGLEIVQRTDAVIQFLKYEWPGDKELFLFIPRYTDCHGLEFYAFGVDTKTGETSSFSFEQVVTTIDENETESTSRGESPYWTTSTAVKPVLEDGKLIVEGGRGAGQDGAIRYTFEPDWAKQRMNLLNREQIP